MEPAQAVSAPCGVVDDFELPFPGIDVSRTDFGIYRTRWGGLHVGIDVAFRRHGEPVKAAARGRVTYSDTEGCPPGSAASSCTPSPRRRCCVPTSR